MRPLLLLVLAGCTAGEEPAAPTFDRVERAAFNRAAAELALPVFWVADAGTEGLIEPDEVTAIGGVTAPPKRGWVADGVFTSAFVEAYDAIADVVANGHPSDGLDAAELRRRELVRQELAQGRPTLVLTEIADDERAFMGHMREAAAAIERIYAQQRGSFGLEEQIPADDPASHALFWRNQGPWCEAPATEGEAACHAIPGGPPRRSGLYPADVQTEGFCEALDESLMSQFTVVRREGDGLVAVPYSVAYAADAKVVADALTAAVDTLPEDEAPLKAYLLAAAKAFGDDDWFAADAAWAAMNAENSRWFLRVGPDEVYFEPCSRKAGFALRLARVDPAAAAWKARLEPVKADLEKALADLAGPPYAPRDVAFDLPEFIGIVINSGDARDALGATIGQSLPNWGPVAEAGGRTVAMTNLFTDPDSIAAKRAQAESLFCPASMDQWSDDPEALLASTILHEAAHNLGPAQEYRVGGKTDEEVFGGPLASMYEELKSQTAALYFTDWLVGKGLIDAEAAKKTHAADIGWAFGKIAGGMYTAGGQSKAYGQLSAIQVGFLMEQGALVWHPETQAANGQDAGCFELRSEQLTPAIEALGREVLSIKATLDKPRAEALRDRFVEGSDDWKALKGTITERWQRTEQASFVYAVR